MSRGVRCRYSSDPMLLWVWRRPAATAAIRPLPWEPPYAAGVALEMAKRQKKKKNYFKVSNRRKLPSLIQRAVMSFAGDVETDHCFQLFQ